MNEAPDKVFIAMIKRFDLYHFWFLEFALGSIISITLLEKLVLV